MYKARLAYKAGAQHGDLVEVHTSIRMESDYRAVFYQDVVRVGSRSQSTGTSSENVDSSRSSTPTVLVSGEVELICVDAVTGAPSKFPASLLGPVD